MQDAAEFERVLRLNVNGTLLLVKHSVPVFARGAGGPFVATYSVAQDSPMTADQRLSPLTLPRAVFADQPAEDLPTLDPGSDIDDAGRLAQRGLMQQALVRLMPL